MRKKFLHFNKQAGGYVLSFQYRDKMLGNIQKAQGQELAFLGALNSAVKATAEDREIDYAFSTEAVVEIGHQCVLWYMNEQGKVIVDPSGTSLNILNAERLVQSYLDHHPLPKNKGKVTREIMLDILPHALFITLNSSDEEIVKYLRSKADLFIIHSFLQITPDVQEACRTLLGHDNPHTVHRRVLFSSREAPSLENARGCQETGFSAPNLALLPWRIGFAS
jgi:hypothetical protein